MCSVSQEEAEDCGFGLGAIRGTPPKCVWRTLDVPLERLNVVKAELRYGTVRLSCCTEQYNIVQ